MSLDQNHSQQESMQQKRSTTLEFLIALLAFLPTIAPSMSLGFSAIALPSLTEETNPNKLSTGEASWFASIASIAIPIGCFICGPFSDKFGRKTSLLVINVITTIGWIVVGAAYYTNQSQYVILIIGRILTGLSMGLASTPPGVYMAEVSSPKFKSVFTAASTSFFALGILIVYTLGYLFKENWGATAFIAAGIGCVFFFVDLFFLPESPQWLVTKDRLSEARRNMMGIYGYKTCNKEIENEITSLVTKRNLSKNNSRIFEDLSYAQRLRNQMKKFTHRSCSRPFLLIITFFFFQQFSGTFSIVFYAVNIVEQARVTVDAYLVTVLIGVVRLLASLTACIVSRKVGRRPLSLFSSVGMTLSMFLLGVYLVVVEEKSLSSESTSDLQWIPIVLLLIYFLTSSVGFLIMPFAMNAEIFPIKIRGRATGTAACIGYLFNFIVVKIYPDMAGSMMSYGVFFFYGSFALVGGVFVYFLLPETKGKSYEEIEAYFVKKQEKV